MLHIRVVPWTCDAEWKYVFDLLFHPDPKKRKFGVDMIQMWQVRFAGGPTIHASVNVTADLVQALLTFEREGDTCEARMTLSAAIIRFISLLSENEKGKNEEKSTAVLCLEMGIPVWITYLRHSSAHAQMPSANIMALACHTCLQFLKDKYWFPQWLILYEMRNPSDVKVQRIVCKWLTQQISPNDAAATLKNMWSESALKKDDIVRIAVKLIVTFPDKLVSLIHERGCRKALWPLSSCLVLKNLIYSLLQDEVIIKMPDLFLEIITAFSAEVKLLSKKKMKELFGFALKTGNVDIIKEAFICCCYREDKKKFNCQIEDDLRRILLECFDLVKRKESSQSDVHALRQILDQIILLQNELLGDGQEETVAMGETDNGQEKTVAMDETPHEDDGRREIEVTSPTQMLEEASYIDDTSWQRLLLD